MKMSAKGRMWLKGLHLISCGIWIGAAACMILINLLLGKTTNGDELYFTRLIVKFIDDYIIIPAAMTTFFTGLFYCPFTHWGFVKYRWVIVKWVTTLAMILFGTFALGPWVNGMVTIADSERLLALQNATFLQFLKMASLGGLLQFIAMLVLIFISVFKPWGKRQRQAPSQNARGLEQ